MAGARITLYSLSGLAFVTLAAFLLSLPVSGNFLRYLWWKTTPAAAAIHGSVTIGGADIHYVSYGNGPPVLLLHGGLSDRMAWFSQVPWLVGAGRQVVVMDTRGHGESGLGKVELSYRQLAFDAIRVLDALGIERTDVIGWSDGANTALLLGRYWPRRVQRIVAISGNFDPSGLTPQASADARTQNSGLAYWLHRWWSGAGKRIGELEKRIKRMWRSSPLLQPADLKAMQTPTLVIVGEKDMISLEHTRRMAQLLPHAELEVIPGGGHATLISHARRVNHDIARFLGIKLP